MRNSIPASTLISAQQTQLPFPQPCPGGISISAPFRSFLSHLGELPSPFKFAPHVGILNRKEKHTRYGCLHDCITHFLIAVRRVLRRYQEHGSPNEERLRLFSLFVWNTLQIKRFEKSRRVEKGF